MTPKHSRALKGLDRMLEKPTANRHLGLCGLVKLSTVQGSQFGLRYMIEDLLLNILRAS